MKRSRSEPVWIAEDRNVIVDIKFAPMACGRVQCRNMFGLVFYVHPIPTWGGLEKLEPRRAPAGNNQDALRRAPVPFLVKPPERIGEWVAR